MDSVAYTKTFVALDIETTGLDPKKAEIIEVGAVKFRNGKEIERFSSLINPKKKIPFIVTDITGITDADVADQPVFSEILPKLSEFVGTLPVVGHNVIFDVLFLREKGLKIEQPLFDTWKLTSYTFLDFGSYSLENIAKRLDLETGNSHRALDDARLSANLFYVTTNRLAYEHDYATIDAVLDFSRNHSWGLRDVFEQIRENMDDVKRKENLVGEEVEVQRHDGIAKPEDWYENAGGSQANAEASRVAFDALSNAEHLLLRNMPDIQSAESLLVASATYAQNAQKKVCVIQPRHILRDKNFEQLLEKVEGSYQNLNFQSIKSPDTYLCERAFDAFVRRPDLDGNEIELAIKILLWKMRSEQGDLDELALQREQVALLPEVTQPDCAELHEECYAYSAWAGLSKADVVITTPLTFLKWLLRNEVMKKIDSIVIDHAHKLEEEATFILTQKLSQGIVLDTLDRLSRVKPGQGFIQRVNNDFPDAFHGELAEYEKKVADVSDSALLFFGVLGIALRKLGNNQENTFFTQLLIDENLWNEQDGTRVSSSCDKFTSHLKALIEGLENLEKILSQKTAGEHLAQEAHVFSKKLKSQMEGFEEIFIKRESVWVNWATITDTKEIVLEKAPLEVASFLESQIWKDRGVALSTHNIVQSKEKASLSSRIAASAFTFCTIGKEDLQDNFALYAIEDLPALNSQNFLKNAMNGITETLEKHKGNAIIIAPTYTACSSYYEKLKPALSEVGFDVYAQGISGGQQKIQEKLIQSKRAILVSTHNFYSRLDLPQDFADILFMTKIPFPAIGAPLIKSREKSFESGFHYTLSLAMQYFTEVFNSFYSNDQHPQVMVLLDSRFSGASYRQDVLSGIPKVMYSPIKASMLGDLVLSWLSGPVEK